MSGIPWNSFPNGKLNGPEGITVGTNGVVYVADTGGSSIRQIAGNTMTT